MGASPAGGQHAARNPTLELAAGGASPKQQAPSRRYLRACKGGRHNGEAAAVARMLVVCAWAACARATLYQKLRRVTVLTEWHVCAVLPKMWLPSTTTTCSGGGGEVTKDAVPRPQ